MTEPWASGITVLLALVLWLGAAWLFSRELSRSSSTRPEDPTGTGTSTGSPPSSDDAPTPRRSYTRSVTVWDSVTEAGVSWRQTPLPAPPSARKSAEDSGGTTDDDDLGQRIAYLDPFEPPDFHR